MSFDARAKRFFPFVVLTMIAVIAYFQASAIGALVASAVTSEGAAAEGEATPAVASVRSRDASPILARNPFDSATGPLDQPASDSADGLDDEDEEEEGAVEQNGGKCSFGRVGLIIAADDSRHSFASITGADGKAKMRYVGDEVEGHRVASMTWDRVYLENGESRCHLAVGEGMTTKTTRIERPEPSGRASSDGASDEADELAASIERVSDTEFNVDRAVMNRIVDGELTTSVRMRPVKEGDEVVGLRMSRIRSGSLLATVGMKNGDQLRSINGFSMVEPEKALEAYARLKTAEKIRIEVMRGGRPTTIELNVR